MVITAYQYMIQKWISNYKLIHSIGRGQYGEVYLGYDSDMEQQVAIKVVRLKNKKGENQLTKQQTKLLENQISILMSVESPYTVKFIDVKKTSGNVYIILEYCNGGNLAAEIKSAKHFTQEKACRFFRQLVEAFRALRKFRVVHRDLKPANILLHNGQIRVADFGFSRTLGIQEMATTSLGSPLHMAPEVLKGDAYTSKVDVWSLGTIFYEMLFGKPPFIASNIHDLQKQIKKGDLKIPLGINPISAQTQYLLHAMLVYDQESRISWEELFDFKFEKPVLHSSIQEEYYETLEQLTNHETELDFMMPAGVDVDCKCKFPSKYLLSSLVWRSTMVPQSTNKFD